MAERHVRAVQLHSKIDDRLTRNILEIIALDIGRDDRPAKTSNRTIAERARVAVNTVRERMKDILKTKELMLSSDGKYSLYALNGELIPYDSTDETTREDDGLTARLLTTDDLTQFEEKLYQRLIQSTQDCINQSSERLYQLYQPIVSIVSANQRATDTEVLGKINTDKYIPPDPRRIVALKTAMSQTVKTPMWVKTEKEYDEGATLLDGWDATPETLGDFAKWWELEGWHQGLPELATLLKEYRNFLNGIKKHSNGNGQKREPANMLEGV